MVDASSIFPVFFSNIKRFCLHTQKGRNKEETIRNDLFNSIYREDNVEMFLMISYIHQYLKCLK